MNLIVSVNIQGLGPDLKFLALKNFSLSANTKIILIQETMHVVSATVSYFRKMFPLWHISAMEANGQSGGLAAIWDPQWIIAKAYSCIAGILISAQIRGQNRPINILNVYAPYKNRSIFWDCLFESEILDVESLLIAGDLNITLSRDEIWGNNKNQDAIAVKIRNEFLCRNYIDILPAKILPTWENGRIGSAYVAKRIDRFILHASVIDILGMPFSTIENIFISDHRPIILRWRNKGFRYGYSFKFNRNCLEDPEYIIAIKKAW